MAIQFIQSNTKEFLLLKILNKRTSSWETVDARWGFGVDPALMSDVTRSSL